MNFFSILAYLAIREIYHITVNIKFTIQAINL